MRKVAIIQSSYIPWKGYFDIVNRADVFVFLDDVQYTVRDWRNRNQIKRRDGGTQWLSVPVLGGREQQICEVRVDGSQNWVEKHLSSIQHSYGKSPYIDQYFDELVTSYHAPCDMLSLVNQRLTIKIAAWLGIDTEFVCSTDLACDGRRDDKLLALVKAVGGEHYISGPSARAYMSIDKFESHGVSVEYVDYDQYPPYPQISEPFDHHVSVLDLLFMTGPDAASYIWGGATDDE